MTLLEAMNLEHKYTIEEFSNLDLPDEDENGNPLQYELIGGRVVPKQSGPSGEHGDIVTRLSSKLDYFAGVSAGEKRVGKVYSGASCNLGNDSNTIPDVCFVLDGRTPPKFKGSIPIAPDLVIEVNSPSDTTEKIQEKIELYQAAGVGLIWSVYMLAKFVVIYRQNDPDIKFVNITGELAADNILPDFSLPVRLLFEG